ncbi:hypothetical protein HMI56_002933, partial [Coelomomyces lativittatus]
MKVFYFVPIVYSICILLQSMRVNSMGLITIVRVSRTHEDIQKFPIENPIPYGNTKKTLHMVIDFSLDMLKENSGIIQMDTFKVLDTFYKVYGAYELGDMIISRIFKSDMVQNSMLRSLMITCSREFYQKINLVNFDHLKSPEKLSFSECDSAAIAYQNDINNGKSIYQPPTITSESDVRLRYVGNLIATIAIAETLKIMISNVIQRNPFNKLYTNLAYITRFCSGNKDFQFSNEIQNSAYSLGFRRLPQKSDSQSPYIKREFDEENLSAEPVKVRKTDEEHSPSSVGTSSRISTSQSSPSHSSPRTSPSVENPKRGLITIVRVSRKHKDYQKFPIENPIPSGNNDEKLSLVIDFSLDMLKKKSEIAQMDVFKQLKKFYKVFEAYEFGKMVVRNMQDRGSNRNIHLRSIMKICATEFFLSMRRVKFQELETPVTLSLKKCDHAVNVYQQAIDHEEFRYYPLSIQSQHDFRFGYIGNLIATIAIAETLKEMIADVFKIKPLDMWYSDLLKINRYFNKD